MLGNVYIEENFFPMLTTSLLYPKESFMSNFKTARKKIFQRSNFQLIPSLLAYKFQVAVSSFTPTRVWEDVQHNSY